MTKPTPAELIEAHQRRLTVEEIEEGLEGATSLELLQNVYRNRTQPLNVRVRCAIEALAHEYPKVSAVQVSHMNGQDFAAALDRAIARSQSPNVINRPPTLTIEHSADELKGPMARLDRRFG